MSHHPFKPLKKIEKLSDTELLDLYEASEHYHGINSKGEHVIHLLDVEDDSTHGKTVKGKTFRDALRALAEHRRGA